MSWLTLQNKKTEDAIIKEQIRKFVKNSLDIMILAKLQAGPLSGYDIITLVNEKFHFTLSPGTVYSVLYSLERKGLIACSDQARKRTYTLTQKGLYTINVISTSRKIKEIVTEIPMLL